MELAILTDIIKETKNNWRFVFENPLYEELNYIPGQLVQLGIPWDERWGSGGPILTRNYSVSSWPNGTNKFELIVTNLIGGKMCDYLFNNAKIGDEVMYRGPMGVFTLPEDLTEREIFFICTGSGISPFRSMINHIYENKIPHKGIKLFFGTRKEEDLVYREELETIAKNLPTFEYIPTLSREQKEGIKEGYVHAHYLPWVDILDEKPLVYFCGWGGMISQGRFELAKKGFEMSKDIRVEIFG